MPAHFVLAWRDDSVVPPRSPRLCDTMHSSPIGKKCVCIHLISCNYIYIVWYLDIVIICPCMCMHVVHHRMFIHMPVPEEAMVSLKKPE